MKREGERGIAGGFGDQMEKNTRGWVFSGEISAQPSIVRGRGRKGKWFAKTEGAGIYRTKEGLLIGQPQGR